MADEIGIHDDGVLTAVRGTIFMAKAETIITSALLKQFTVEAATVAWATACGRTSATCRTTTCPSSRWTAATPPR
ncbi:hypothetical protein ACTGNK_07885 [Bifidobacterium longum]